MEPKTLIYLIYKLHYDLVDPVGLQIAAYLYIRQTHRATFIQLEPRVCAPDECNDKFPSFLFVSAAKCSTFFPSWSLILTVGVQ